jgi:thiol-disulfide isomerase/thioredoxin
MTSLHTATYSLGIACLFMLAGCATSGSAPGGGGQAGAAIVGQPMPELSLQPLSGAGPVSLASFKGKVVLLDIWASWCAPCKEELPFLDELAGRLSGQGVEIVAVSIDDDRANADQFLRSRARWSLALFHDPQGKVPERLQPPKMPTSYLVDRAGVLREINAGFERSDVAKIESRLRALAELPVKK